MAKCHTFTDYNELEDMELRVSPSDLSATGSGTFLITIMDNDKFINAVKNTIAFYFQQ